jgi:prepilin-type N-terminal cleavage/methylation domain-containing protein
MMKTASRKQQPAGPDASLDAPKDLPRGSGTAARARGVGFKLLRGRVVRVVHSGAVFDGGEKWLLRGRVGKNADPAFTLIELVVVMALLVILLGVSEPSLARSFHGRDLTQEALRLLAVTEYARDEATSTGAPMVVWVDADSGEYGTKAKTGYEDSGARSKEYTLHDGLKFQGTTTSTKTSGQEKDAVEFEADGTLDPSSVMSLEIVNRTNETVQIAQTKDAWGYEIVKPQ